MSVNIKHYLQQWDFSERIIIVCDKGSVFVDITYSPNGKDRKAVIWGLFVGSVYRCNGVGNDLLLYAEEQVKVRGIREVEIAWESPTPLWVYNWYIRKGYVEKDYENGYSRMCKVLNVEEKEEFLIEDF